MESAPATFTFVFLMFLASCNSAAISSLEAAEAENAFLSAEDLQLAKSKGLNFDCSPEGGGYKCCSPVAHLKLCAGIEVLLEDDRLKLHESLKLGSIPIIDKTHNVSPSELCVKIPTQRINGRACLGLEDVKVKEESVYVCAKGKFIVQDEKLFSGKIGCVNVPIPHRHRSTSVAN